jgi:hypothetical protein
MPLRHLAPNIPVRLNLPLDPDVSRSSDDAVMKQAIPLTQLLFDFAVGEFDPGAVYVSFMMEVSSSADMTWQ